MVQPRALRGANTSERGTALIVVSFVLIIILVGGLAAIAVTSGELSSSRGYRTRQVTRTCAEAAIERARAIVATTTQASGTLGNLTYQTGHYGDSSAQDTLTPLDAGSFDVVALFEGENVTNAMFDGSSSGLQVLAATATCSGSGRLRRASTRFPSPSTAA
jgi:Tfp pilus assembly protein PilX